MAADETYLNFIRAVDEFKKEAKRYLGLADIVGALEFRNNSASLNLTCLGNNLPLVIPLSFDYSSDYHSSRKNLLKCVAEEIRRLERYNGTVSVSGLAELGYDQDIYHTDDPVSKRFIQAIEKKGPIIYSIR
jgi:hypothetical protein